MCVLQAKEQHPSLLHLALPGRNQTSGWSALDKARYQAILDSADEVWYAAEVCTPDSMRKRNRYPRSGLALHRLSAAHGRGGTLYTNYALDSDIPG